MPCASGDWPASRLASAEASARGQPTPAGSARGERPAGGAATRAAADVPNASGVWPREDPLGPQQRNNHRRHQDQPRRRSTALAVLESNPLRECGAATNRRYTFPHRPAAASARTGPKLSPHRPDPGRPIMWRESGFPRVRPRGGNISVRHPAQRAAGRTAAPGRIPIAQRTSHSPSTLFAPPFHLSRVGPAGRV